MLDVVLGVRCALGDRAKLVDKGGRVRQWGIGQGQYRDEGHFEPVCIRFTLLFLGVLMDACRSTVYLLLLVSAAALLLSVLYFMLTRAFTRAIMHITRTLPLVEA